MQKSWSTQVDVRYGERELGLAGYWSPAERLKIKSRITNPPKKKRAMMAMNPMIPSNR